MTKRGRRSPRGFRVQRVEQAVTEEVEGEDGDEDRQARNDHVQRVELVVVHGVREQLAPGGGGRGYADAEERQRRLEQDVGGDDQRPVHQDRRGQVGQQL